MQYIQHKTTITFRTSQNTNGRRKIQMPSLLPSSLPCIDFFYTVYRPKSFPLLCCVRMVTTGCHCILRLLTVVHNTGLVYTNFCLIDYYITKLDECPLAGLCAHACGNPCTRVSGGEDQSGRLCVTGVHRINAYT